jgi:cation diffusion facilitator CzcD-associated flavoprotein CzcO
MAGGWSITITDNTMPEPSTALLIGAGMAGLAALRAAARRRDSAFSRRGSSL